MQWLNQNFDHIHPNYGNMNMRFVNQLIHNSIENGFFFAKIIDQTGWRVSNIMFLISQKPLYASNMLDCIDMTDFNFVIWQINYLIIWKIAIFPIIYLDYNFIYVFC